MNVFTSKSITFLAIALLVIMILPIVLVALPVQAQETQDITSNVTHGGNPITPTGGPIPSGATPAYSVPTVARMSLGPSPVGVNQPITVNLWTSPAPGAQRAQSGYTVTITAPNGTVFTVGPLPSFIADGTNWFTFIPDVVGTWKLQFAFAGNYLPAGVYLAGQTLNNASLYTAALLAILYPATAFGPAPTTIPIVGTQSLGYTGPINYTSSVYYQASQTPVQTLTVQQDMVASWPTASLPTDYWTRPVIANFREWSSIMGDYPWYGPGGGTNWPADTSIYYSPRESYIPYTQGPTSAHIVWRRQGVFSGLIGGIGGTQSLGGTAGGIQTLPSAGLPTIVYNGRAYQTISKPMPMLINGSQVIETTSVWECYDVRTGQIYWDQTGITQAPTAIEYAYGGAAIIGGGAQATTTVSLVSAANSRLIKYNPFSGAVTVNVSIAPLTTGTFYMNQWCLSVQTLGSGPSAQYKLINWTIAGSSTDVTSRVASNVSWPISSLPTTWDLNAGVVANVVNVQGGGTYLGINVVGISLTTGAILWNTTIMNEYLYSGSCQVADHGLIAVLSSNGYWLAWNLNSGQLAWKGQIMDYPWGATAFGAYAVQSAYGLFYWESYDGVYAYYWNNGSIAWHFLSPGAYPYDSNYYDNGTAQNPFDQGAIVAGGILYTYNNEHSAINPVARGWRFFAINATTGQGIWNATVPGQPGAVQDGYLFADSFYDGYLYVFGKGRSETTVTASLMGNSIVIQGSVLDKSPGDLGTYTNPVARTDFPTNVPCVSDESMQTYMDYLYMQIPIPIGYSVTGVPVQLYATDQNGNTISIGTTTSDLNGFRFSWTPLSNSLWTIQAVFPGTDAYSSSYAGASAAYNVVSTSPTPTGTLAPSNAATSSELITYMIAGVIAIIIAIAVLGVLILRKH
jgi:hypothetical protein